MREFSIALEQCLREKDSYSHPFVCAGSPPIGGIFVVGHNAATRLSEPFCNYWSKEGGFKKSKFLDDYRSQPRREGRLKGARLRIEEIAKVVGPENLLDTNIYTHSTETENDLKKENKGTEVFEFLLSTLKPQVVLAHGWKAIKFFRKRAGVANATPYPQIADFEGHKFALVCSRHLSRIAVDAARDIGANLQKELRSRVSHLL